MYNELYHYGVKGMRWGHRKSRTSSGSGGRSSKSGSSSSGSGKKKMSTAKKIAIGAAIVGGTALVAYGGYKLSERNFNKHLQSRDLANAIAKLNSDLYAKSLQKQSSINFAYKQQDSIKDYWQQETDYYTKRVKNNPDWASRDIRGERMRDEASKNLNAARERLDAIAKSGDEEFDRGRHFQAVRDKANKQANDFSRAASRTVYARVNRAKENYKKQRATRKQAKKRR